MDRSTKEDKEMKQSYNEKSAWITGGGSGLGKAMALRYSQLGARVAVSGRRADSLEETVGEIERQGGSGLAVSCDVGQEQQIASAVDQVIKRFGSLDVAVANAAFPLKGNVETLETDDWRRQFEVNVIGAAMTAKHALPELRKTKGRLALVGSAASLATVPMFGAYCASKYALRAIGQTLAMELHGSGVSCTVLYPGYMNTEFTQIDNKGHFNPNKKKIVNRFMWSSEKSAKVCVRAIHKRKREFSFTPMGKIFCWCGAHTPGLFHFLITQFGTPGIETLDAA
jgi:NAD(P)-dependent dehydrogenase (short-subunit alcohol dehydrogenase family)